jgi:hypothetical protein
LTGLGDELMEDAIVQAIWPAAVVFFAACLSAEATSFFSKDALIRAIADATAYSELCVNWSIDPDVVAEFRRRESIAVDGHYRAVFGFAFARDHAEAMRGGNFPASCDRALALYGPEGQLIPGLVRALYHGAVAGQTIDLNR